MLCQFVVDRMKRVRKQSLLRLHAGVLSESRINQGAFAKRCPPRISGGSGNTIPPSFGMARWSSRACSCPTVQLACWKVKSSPASEEWKEEGSPDAYQYCEVVEMDATAHRQTGYRPCSCGPRFERATLTETKRYRKVTSFRGWAQLRQEDIQGRQRTIYAACRG